MCRPPDRELRCAAGARHRCAPFAQLDQRGQEAGQRLAGAGRRDQQRGAAGARLLQQRELMRARRPSPRGKPARERRRQRHGIKARNGHGLALSEIRWLGQRIGLRMPRQLSPTADMSRHAPGAARGHRPVIGAPSGRIKNRLAFRGSCRGTCRSPESERAARLPSAGANNPKNRRSAMVRFGGSLAVLFISAALLQSTKAAEDVKGDGLLILAQLGDQRGQISTGQCKCKDQCEVGQSIFSQGRTVAQCESKCRQAFSGCTKGEVRSTQRRDLIPTSASTQDRRRIAAPAPRRTTIGTWSSA